METSTYWQQQASLPTFPPLGGDDRADVVIVGAGNTGILTAYLMAKSGLKVILLDQRTVAAEDTARSTAHLTYVTDKRFHDFVNEQGIKIASQVWHAGQWAINEIEKIASQEMIDCHFQRVPGYLIPSIDQKEPEPFNSIINDALFAKKAGFRVSLEVSVPFFRSTGLKFYDQAIINPLEFAKGLLPKIQQCGGRIYEFTKALSFNNKRSHVVTNRGIIACSRVVIASERSQIEASSLCDPLFYRSMIVPYSSYVIAALAPVDTVPQACYWDTSKPYYHLRIDRTAQHDVILFGGLDHPLHERANQEQIFRALERRLLEFIPRAFVTAQWSGQVIQTRDGYPYIGENSRGHFISTGFCGNGLTFGMIAALMARDWIHGVTNRWHSLFSLERKPAAGHASTSFPTNSGDAPLVL